MFAEAAKASSRLVPAAAAISETSAANPENLRLTPDDVISKGNLQLVFTLYIKTQQTV